MAVSDNHKSLAKSINRAYIYTGDIAETYNLGRRGLHTEARTETCKTSSLRRLLRRRRRLKNSKVDMVSIDH